MWKRVLLITSIVILILGLPLSFTIGRYVGEMRNHEPILNRCLPVEEIPFDGYVQYEMGRFDEMHHLYYGEHRYDIESVTLPEENMTYEEYYSSVNHEYFNTTEGILLACGMYK